MALVLSLKQGQDFYVNDEQFILEEVVSETNFTVKRVSTGKLYAINGGDKVDIMPQVKVQAGADPHLMMARVSIVAPMEIMILRGDKYRNPPDHIRQRGK